MLSGFLPAKKGRSGQKLPVKDPHEKISKTYANNRVRLTRFAEWADLPVEEITWDMTKGKLKKLLEEDGLTPANVNKHLVALKTAFNYAIIEGKLATNPTKGIPEFSTDNAPKFIPSVDQVAKILLLAKPLDRAYLTLIAYTAARMSEISKLLGGCALGCGWQGQCRHRPLGPEEKGRQADPKVGAGNRQGKGGPAICI